MLSNFLLKKGTLWGVLFFCSFQVLAQNWQDPQWLRLLVYRETLFGYESEADHQSFFIHPEGKTDPEKELKSLIESLNIKEADPKKNIHCRFPARLRWLKKHMKVPDADVICEDYDKFKNRLAAKSISVVFSSYYLNNPGSAFGHTFIRLGKKTGTEIEADSTSTELLDTGINYGAMTEGAGPILFAIGGLAGWFQGNYNAVPYYYKVREYNDYETRDLWSYQLDMTQDEIDLIVDHIWELGHTKFDYFFLTENCSYHVLSILESARPKLNLHAHLPSLYTIPPASLKPLVKEGIVKNITFRPSSSTQFYHQLALLNKKEQKAFRKLMFKNKPVSDLSPERSALIYDTALSYVDYKYGKKILKGDEEAQKIKRPLLVARSKIPVRSKELDFSEKMKKPPHLSHGQKRLMLSYLNQDNERFMDLEWKFAFHDMLDFDLGYPPKTRLDVMKGTIRTDGKELQLREYSVLDVMMLGKWDRYNKSSSWKARLGQWQTRYKNKFLSTQGFQAGYGISYGYKAMTPYALLHGEASYVSEQEEKMKFAYGSDLGFLLEFNSNWKMMSTYEWRVHPWSESRFNNELQFSNRFYGMGAYFKDYTDDGNQEFGLKTFFYF